MPYSIPTLIILFNRPDNAIQLIERLRMIGPEKLFVAIDGPRPDRTDDTKAVNECIELIETIDWPCEIHKKISPINLGCGQSVSSAINWFFSEVEEGIILEDDCIPSEAFFSFCELLLPEYSDKQQVMMISGNRWDEEFLISEDYFFSLFTSTWGWATWRRAWKSYDYTMSDWPKVKNSPVLFDWLYAPSIRTFWLGKLDSYYERLKIDIDNWDFQWQYAIFKNNGLVIIPKENLIQNIGVEGVHTYSIQKDTHFRPVASKFYNNNPPKDVHPNYGYDEYHCQKLLNNSPTFISKVLYSIKQISSMNTTYMKKQITKFFLKKYTKL